MAAKLTKKEQVEKQTNYLLHFVFFICGIIAGLLYYKIFLVGYY